MCFYLKYKGKKPVPKIATEDMVAYKILKKRIFDEKGSMDSGHLFESFYYNEVYPPLTILYPRYLGQTWKKNNIVRNFTKSSRVIRLSIRGWKMLEINEGIHFFKTKEYAELNVKDLSTKMFSQKYLIKIFPFIIPKGTKYYENENEYVALRAMRLEGD